MRKSKLQLYAPFLALALLQAAFVVLAPSKGEGTDPLGNLQTSDSSGFANQAGGVGGNKGAGGFTIDPTTGATIDPATGQPITGSGATGGAGGASNPGQVAGGGGGGGGIAVAGDTSHCKGDKQTDVISTSPPCVPKFVGDNGGATYPGVTATEIKLVVFGCQPNEQVNAILATQGLAASTEETAAMIDATIKWMEATYEFYGRKLVWENVVGDCPTSPPDPAKTRQAAAEVAKTHPFFVLHAAGGATSHDVWSQAGIISLGGPSMHRSFFAGRRPFRYDLFPDGVETADWAAEYVCKKLVGKPASNAGALIHPSIGGRSTIRKIGILTFDNGTGEVVPNAQRMAQLIEQCGGKPVPLIYYESDINRAAEQTRVVVAKLIEEKVTTVICHCDPIAPVFLTKGLTQNNYFPEHLLDGAYLLDYDVLGRLYEPTQWIHAFGPSQLAEPVEFSQSNASKVWRAAGNSGQPCAACNLITGYMLFVGSMIHQAGPNLNPLTIEQALIGAKSTVGGWEATGHNPSEYLLKFGPEDYTAISDFREVYWSQTAKSKIDGKNGAYISLNGGRRYAGGELDGSFAVPPSAS